jgi:hypothetical protein
MAQMTPRQLQLAFDMDVAKKAKQRENLARLKRERTDMAGLLEAARRSGTEALFSKVHGKLGPHFTSAAPFQGALVFYVGRSGRSALRVFPDGGERSGILRFDVDLVELTAAISSIFPIDRAAVINALPPLLATSNARWRSGIFKSASDVGRIVSLFDRAAEDGYHAAIKQAGDEDWD